MEKLQYNIHFILQSEYKFIAIVLINMLICIPFYYNNISYCMMGENPEITMTQTATELRLQQEITELNRRLGYFQRELAYERSKVAYYVSLDGISPDCKTYSRLYDTTKLKLDNAEAEILSLKKQLKAHAALDIPFNSKPKNTSYFTMTNIVCASFFLGSVLYVASSLMPILSLPSLW